MTDINLQSLKSTLLNNGVEYAALFGSRARGDNRPDSDLDVLIRFKKDDKSLLDLIHIENLLSDEFGIKVDLVTEGGMSPYIKPYIIKDLKVIIGN
ncbi:MAG: nucleotidyltransferase family protein [Candidatus Taylorbacteria bacterium]|nr:nucleotidyltransferase family protein [Candidatus Taylorbacteria bacterium]